MTLQDFSQEVTKKFEKTHDIDTRMDFARQLAEHYGFEHPAMILFFTHPEIAKLPISDRCQKMGITEEQLMLFQKQEGFQRFLQDFQGIMVTTLRHQALMNAGTALTEDRSTFDKFGNETKNHSLEVEVLRAMSAEKQPGVTVNLQNNVWSEARKALGQG